MNACIHRLTQCLGMKENYREITLSSENYTKHTDGFFLFLSKTKRRNFIKYSLLLSMLYMFQAVSPPIIRSSKTVHTASGI